MKKYSRLLSICLLSVFVILAGISRSAQAHTVDLAYRCEADGSVTFFAATDHLGLKKNSGDLLLSMIGSGGTEHAFSDWIADLPEDVTARWGSGSIDESEVEWQTVNIRYVEPGFYVISTRDEESHVADLAAFWEGVEIDCGMTAVEVDIDVDPGHASESGGMDSKGKSKSKDSDKGIAKAKGKAKAKAKGKDNSKGKAKGHDKSNSKGKGKAKGHDKSDRKTKGKDVATGDIDSTSDLLLVAILSNEYFDATRVDETTVDLGDEGLDGLVYPFHAEVEDANGDGLPDLVLHFSRSEMFHEQAIDKMTVELRLRGFTDDGLFIFGYDTVPGLH